MLEAIGLTKNFGPIRVTQNVSLRVDRGERRVVLGPNGAGKTTLFNLLAGELRPNAGTIRLGGRDVTNLPVSARGRLGLGRSYQKNNLFTELTIRENLTLAVATAAGAGGGLWRDTLADATLQRIVADVAAQVALTELFEHPVNTISYGARRQLEVGLALATRPKVLLMDEPTSGVGPEMIRAFHALLKTLPRELAVVIIEHDMDLALDVADRVTVLDHGEIVFEGTPEQTRQSSLVNDIYLGAWGHA